MTHELKTFIAKLIALIVEARDNGVSKQEIFDLLDGVVEATRDADGGA